ncbi:sugar phosphate isomerase/epimerase family protein [Paenibacillus sp. 1P07SE]|uniref:sugar phosphate isomerase/epimerase family protein n=1 Tax=Paenibacillus sp. 1P07SE TaxID=3132209 RepID=UPI0039A52CC3
MAIYAVNSWSFERQLGPLRMVSWNSDKREHELTIESHPEKMTLPEFIIRLGEAGYEALELSYAQFQDSSPSYLEELRIVAERSGVRLASLLIDDGDLSATDEHRRRIEAAWYSKWIDVAASAGFERVRISAGQGESGDREALRRAAAGFKMLADYAKPKGVRVVTENLGSLLSDAKSCLTLLELCEGKIGFTGDFGNFKTDKYRQLAEVMPHAETVHAKADVRANGGLDLEDFRRCVEISTDSGFSGPYSLTYLEEADVWERLEEMRQAADRILTSAGGMQTR